MRVAVGERAEFGTNEWFPYGQLEGIVSNSRLPCRRLVADSCLLFPQVIVKKNESYDAEDMQI